MNLIGCLDRPSSGEIWLDGQNVAGISSSDLNRVRAEKIGFIFQQFHLIPFLTAVENVMLAQYFHSMVDEGEAMQALKQVGMDVTLIPAEKIASEDLSRYGTIVLGIRAYDTQKDVVTNNKRLLDFVSAGGTLVVQYNRLDDRRISPAVAEAFDVNPVVARIRINEMFPPETGQLLL